jgi:hypothetical protein
MLYGFTVVCFSLYTRKHHLADKAPIKELCSLNYLILFTLSVCMVNICEVEVSTVYVDNVNNVR